MSTPATPPATPRGGRRVAARRRSRPSFPPATVGAVVLVLLAAAAVGLTRSPGGAEVVDPTSAGLVDRTVLACPEPPRGASGETRALLAPLPRLGAEGEWRVGTPGATRTTPVRARGEVVELDGGSVLEADGAAAAGAFAARADTSGQALAVTACGPPRARWWFVGAGAALDHDSVLTLANVDPGPAVVDVRVLSADGEVETVGTRGIALAAGETRSIPLADVAPQREELAVAVEASRGRVAAAVSDRVADGAAAPDGLEWLPAAEVPSRVVRLVGVPAQARDRTLLVANPSDLEALVDVEVSGSRGTFTPVGARTISVPPGAVVSVDAADLVTAEDAAALRVRSRVPVVAALRSRSRVDHGYAGGVLPLTEPAVAPVVAGADGRLQVSAGAGGATVDVSAWTEDGRELDETRVDVDPAATLEVPILRRAAYVVVTPRRGNVTGAAVYTGPAGTTMLPLAPLPVRLALPVVVPGPR